MFIPAGCKENLGLSQFGPSLPANLLESLLSSDLYRTCRWLQFWPPGTIEWKTFDLPIPGLPPALETLRILQLSDFHFRGGWSSMYDRLIARISSNPPDVLLLTGDFVDHKRNPYPALPSVRRLLGALNPNVPRFAIVGNHDDYVVAYELRDLGITFLNGKRTLLDVHGGTLEFIGLPGVHRRELEEAFLRRLPPKADGIPRIVLSHFPDHCLRIGSIRPTLIFSGHTHGGQVCLPGGFPLIWHDAVPRRAARGVRKVNGAWLVVSRGLGATGLPMRLFCPPDVMEVHLRSSRGRIDSEAPL